jgi:hypothetical protein
MSVLLERYEGVLRWRAIPRPGRRRAFLTRYGPAWTLARREQAHAAGATAATRGHVGVQASVREGDLHVEPTEDVRTPHSFE